VTYHQKCNQRSGPPQPKAGCKKLAKLLSFGVTSTTSRNISQDWRINKKSNKGGQNLEKGKKKGNA
jgi:hypothetical protein